MASFLFNVYGSEVWKGDVFISITTFEGNSIITSTDYRLTVSKARELAAKLSNAIDEIEIRNMVEANNE